MLILVFFNILSNWILKSIALSFFIKSLVSHTAIRVNWHFVKYFESSTFYQTLQKTKLARKSRGTRTSPGPFPLATLTVALLQACWNCGRKAHETCSGCNVARYCGPFCQHKDWDSHHKVCSPALASTSTSSSISSSSTSSSTAIIAALASKSKFSKGAEAAKSEWRLAEASLRRRFRRKTRIF